MTQLEREKAIFDLLDFDEIIIRKVSNGFVVGAFEPSTTETKQIVIEQQSFLSTYRISEVVKNYFDKAVKKLEETKE